METLTEQTCVPCEGGTPPLSKTEIAGYIKQLKRDWEIVDGRKIRREFSFKDFKQAMKFANDVARIAEAEGHHPDIHIFYNKVAIELWTHANQGLSPNDFIVAAKVETLAH